ncbi:hypothetical protein VTJ49DRAFT_7232 [Mycothermus thermophilus]|uniref:Mitochondrial intermediate peptidase n=1 Tax=Humicola insolens TaxID=85995 RepID=A0ABR3VHJ0_HUMIN
MIKAVGRPTQWPQWQRWICSTCRRLRVPHDHRQQRRSFAASRPSSKFLPLDEPIIPASHAPTFRREDAALRSIFDQPDFWKDFSKLSGSMNVGLFRNAYLKKPQGFLTFAEVSLKKARVIVDRVLAASSLDEYRAIVRDLDRLSDILCRVLDMADFVRMTHPNHETQRMASAAWEMVYQYMNELNTMTGLHDQLATAMADPDVTSGWSEEEKAVAEVLHLDFMKSAVNLPKKYRDRFVELSSEISAVGSAFVQEAQPEQPTLVIPSSEMHGMDPLHARALTRYGKVHLYTMSGEAVLALRTVHEPDTRKVIYYASRTASRRSVQLLEHLMRLRSELATLSGFESYGHLALRDRMMARSPEAVDKFLRALTESNQPRARQEMAELLLEKQKDFPHSTRLDPWDKDYYQDLLRRPLGQARDRHGDNLSPYFSLGVVMQGLSRLFSALYGIRLVPQKPLRGETWDRDVRRLDVWSDTDGHVAVLYCDLFYRPDKSPNPAHYTVRCSREIFQDEIAEAWEQSKQDPDVEPFATPEHAATDGMNFSRCPNGSIKQLPTIALVCDFPRPSADQPALLSFFQMETLFHEMGHAIHSVLARTSFQTVSGTRCATDLAELPSTLMEYFAADATVLGQFARHHETNEPLPYRMVAQKVRQSRRFEALDTENQIILAMLDQALHSPLAAQPDFDSTQIFHELQHTFGTAPPDPSGTRWQGFFGHLSGYGSTYYSYLFDRVLAQRVWDVVFKSGEGDAALLRENGEHLKESLLKWGGARDPWRCLAEVLREEKLADGGEKAMELVGSWGSVKKGE